LHHWWLQDNLFVHPGDPGVSAARTSVAIIAAVKTGDASTDNALKTALFRTVDCQQRKIASMPDHFDGSAAARAGTPTHPTVLIMVVCHRLGSFQD
jgi:hypothetical protein